jgi:hypothetical protein
MARNTQAEQIADPERRLQRIERAIEGSPYLSLPSDVPTGPTPEQRAEIEQQAQATREAAAKRPKAAHFGDPIFPI